MKNKLVFLYIILLLSATAAMSQTNCVPLAGGVPGIPGAPNWWNPALGEPTFNSSIDAPGWRGSFALGYPSGTATTEEMHFRALHLSESGKEFIYLSWWGKVVPDLSSLGMNKLIVGFTNGGTAPAFAFNITPNVTSAQTATQAYTLQVSVNTGSSWGPYLGPVPTWLKGTVTPATDGTGRIWLITSPNKQWAVHMRIPISTIATAGNISDGLPINPATFRMWYEFRTSVPAATFGFAPYKFPRAIADADPFTDEPPPVAGWGLLHLNSSVSVPDAGCSTNGVSIKANDIGTQNSTSQHWISLLSANTFFAKPRNQGTSTANNVRARFRIANWGVGPTPNSGLWVDLGPSAGVPLGGTNIVATGQPTITLPYDISGPSTADLCERCKYPVYYSANTALCTTPSCSATNNSKTNHQCLLVELTGTGVDFLNDSVYTNMDFVNASTMTDTAEINLNGEPESSPSSLARDVYLYVERFNMPELSSGGNPEDPRPANGLAAAAVTSDYNTHRPKHNSPFDVSRPKDERRKEILQLLQDGQMTFEDVAHQMPTYIVHAYYDSGIRNTATGGSRAVLRPMQSFGYFVLHDGEPEGWITELQGAVKLSPDWYRIGVPDNGIARIYPKIEAVDSPASPGSSSPYRFFFDLGPNFPGDGFASFVEGQWSANVGVEKFVRPNLSVEAIAGYHLFEAESDGERFEFCSHIQQFSANIKRYFGPGPLHWFMNAGGGAYHLDPDDTWEWGVNVGGGFLYDINSRWGFEGALNQHRVNSSPDDLNWSTLQAGLRIRF